MTQVIAQARFVRESQPGRREVAVPSRRLNTLMADALAK
jgi:hypothetical protein